MPTRRIFLQDSALAGAGLLGARAVHSFAADAPRERNSKPIRAAVIGSTGRGNYGHGLDAVWRHVPGVELVAVADDNRAGLAAAMTKLELKEGYTDYREMLDRAKPDVISIAQRWVDRHHEMTLAVAERGIHIFSEKPLCRTLIEADQMVAACDRNNVKFALAHQTRYSPLIGVVQEIIRSGKLGKVLEFRARGKEDKRGGGEDLWVLGSHLMNLIVTFGGMPDWCFATVQQGGKPVTKADVADGNEGFGPLCGDHVSATYGLTGGVTAYFASQRDAAGKPSRFALQILGTAGALEITTGYPPIVNFIADGSWSPGRSGKAWEHVSSQGIGKPETAATAGHDAGNVAVATDLLDAVAKNRKPLCSVHDGRATVEMIAAVFESHRVGGPVSLPLDTRVNPLTLLN